MFPGMTDKDVEKVITSVIDSINGKQSSRKYNKLKGRK